MLSSCAWQRICEGEIHVIATEENVLANADSLEFEIAILSADGDEAEVRRASANVADQNDVAGVHLVAPEPPARAVQA